MFASESPGPSADNDRCEQQEDADEREHAAKDGPQAEVRDMIVQQGNVTVHRADAGVAGPISPPASHLKRTIRRGTDEARDHAKVVRGGGGRGIRTPKGREARWISSPLPYQLRLALRVGSVSHGCTAP
jgi:hypothetical protein